MNGMLCGLQLDRGRLRIFVLGGVVTLLQARVGEGDGGPCFL